MDHAALGIKLSAGHPVTGAFDADASVAADQCNVVNCIRDVASVTGQQLFEAAVPAEYDALTTDQ